MLVNGTFFIGEYYTCNSGWGGGEGEMDLTFTVVNKQV